jgi:Transmembrane secretion effector
LRSRNCRLFFGGQAVSLVGTWMTQTAVLWLVYQLTGSAVYLGLIAFVEQVPNFFLVPITGGMIEHGDRRKILLATQVLSLLHALALTLLVFGNITNIASLIGLSLAKGAISAFDITARQVFIADIVADKPALRSAISINALIISAARFVGPGMAGLIIARSGVGVCFAIDWHFTDDADCSFTTTRNRVSLAKVSGGLGLCLREFGIAIDLNFVGSNGFFGWFVPNSHTYFCPRDFSWCCRYLGLFAGSGGDWFVGGQCLLKLAAKQTPVRSIIANFYSRFGFGFNWLCPVADFWLVAGNDVCGWFVFIAASGDLQYFAPNFGDRSTSRSGHESIYGGLYWDDSFW